jgi:hypothetical protein
METKLVYEAPVVEVVELNMEGIVCGSPYDMQDYNYGSLDEG